MTCSCLFFALFLKNKRIVASGDPSSPAVLVAATGKVTASKTYPQAVALQAIAAIPKLLDSGVSVNDIPRALDELRLQQFGGSATWGNKKEKQSLEDLVVELGRLGEGQVAINQLHSYNQNLKKNGKMLRNLEAVKPLYQPGKNKKVRFFLTRVRLNHHFVASVLPLLSPVALMNTFRPWSPEIDPWLGRNIAS
jgi:hypothetical protein